ncbi:MAG: hypothetical protein ACR2FN_11910 [Chitinophagaceae bacterium]
MIKPQTITIEKKRFAIVPENEYLNLLQDVADLKKVLKRRKEPGMEAMAFFKKLAEKNK